jgi:RNA polymerase sigma factor (sigma-70 family)
MPNRQPPGALAHLRGLIAARHDRATTDRELLDRFVGGREEAAFAALLQRHGGMVLGVCRRVLRDAHDAEDACQATFLVLARKAPSIRRRDSLGSWLHGVAVRVARNLRRSIARQRRHAGPVADVPQPDAAAELTWREVREALDEELQRLAGHFRGPLVLCCLEGLSRDEAAQQLGVSPGTLKGRLERARDLLRARLSRRGITLSAACLAATLGPDASATVPPALALAIRKAALRSQSGVAVAAVVSPRVAALVEGVTRRMLGSTFAVGAVVVGLSLLIACLGLAVHQTPVPKRPAGEQPNAPAPGRPDGEQPKVEGGKQARTDLHGDPLPPGAVARLGTLRFRHGEHIQAIVFAPDGKAVASASGRGSVVLHELATGKRLRSFPDASDPPARGVHGFAFAPDGKTWAASVGGRRVCVWEAATGKQVRQFDFTQGQVCYLTFSHDGRTLAGAGEQHSVQVWDVGAGKELGRIAHPPAILLGLAVAPNGKALVTAGLNRGGAGTSLYLWDTASGRELRRWQAHLGEVYTLDFSPDGQRLASASVEGDNRLRVWTVPAGERQLDLPGEFASVRFAPGGKVLAAAAGNSVSLRDADTGKELRRLPRGPRSLHGNGVAVFSPDGATLALTDPWTISLWDVATGAQLGPRLDGHDQVVEKVLFLPDGKALASLGGNGLSFWQLQTARRVGHFVWSPNDYSQRGLSPDGKSLAVAGEGEIGFWDTATGKKVGGLQGLPKYSLNALTFSPDGEALAAMVGEGTVRIWDVRTGRLVRRITPPRAPASLWPGQSLAFSPDGRTLAVGSGNKDGAVRLWEVAVDQGLRQVFQLPGATGQIAFSADGKVLAAATSGPGGFDQGQTILVWELRTGRALCRLEGVSSYFALSPDGKSVVTVGETPRLWEVATGKVRARLRGHADTVWTAAFSPDGRWLATGSQDTTVLIWDVRNLNGGPPGAPPSRRTAE